MSFNVLSNETVKNPQYSTSAENNDIESNIPKTITVQVEKEIHIKTPPYFVILIMNMRELFFLFVALSLRMILSLIWQDTNTNGRREMLIKYAAVLLRMKSF